MGKLVWKLLENVSIYFSYIYGYKIGGFNFDVFVVLLIDLFDLVVFLILFVVFVGLNLFGFDGDFLFVFEMNDVFEFGIKIDLFDDCLRVNVILFYSKLENF